MRASGSLKSCGHEARDSARTFFGGGAGFSGGSTGVCRHKRKERDTMSVRGSRPRGKRMGDERGQRYRRRGGQRKG